VGCIDDRRELSLDGDSSIGSGGIEDREGFRESFAETGAYVGFVIGSALERMLENAIGSDGLLGF